MLAIHCICATDAASPSWIAGSATLMTDASREATLEPRIDAASTQRFACEAHPGVSGAPRITPVSHGGLARLSTSRSQSDDAERRLHAMAPVQIEEQSGHLIEERREDEAAGVEWSEIRHPPHEIRHDALGALVVAAEQNVAREPPGDVAQAGGALVLEPAHDARRRRASTDVGGHRALRDLHRLEDAPHQAQRVHHLEHHLAVERRRAGVQQLLD